MSEHPSRTEVLQIAHDLNNHLNVVLGYVELLSSTKVPEAKASEFYAEIRVALRSSRDLVRQLQTPKE